MPPRPSARTTRNGPTSRPGPMGRTSPTPVSMYSGLGPDHVGAGIEAPGRQRVLVGEAGPDGRVLAVLVEVPAGAAGLPHGRRQLRRQPLVVVAHDVGAH